MALFATCPVPAEPTDVTLSSCPFEIGQIQQILIQRKYSTGTTLNSITIATTNPNLRATWTALEAASDSTKVVPLPYIDEPVNEAGAKREYGSGNAVRNGIPLTIGVEPSKFTCKILRYSQATIAQIKTFQSDNVGVFLIGEDGSIVGLTDDTTTPTIFKPIPIRSFFTSDLVLGGYEGVESNNVEFYFEPNWSDKLHKVSPSDFEGLTAFGA